MTARKGLQVCELADLYNLRYKRIGRHYGKSKILKVVGIFIRALQLLPTIIKEKPVLAFSHGSREQLLLASMLGIPSMLITDYEHGKFLPLLKLTWLIVPEVISNDSMKNKCKNLLKYPGIKEDIYVHGFKPDHRIQDELGLNNKSLVVTMRPPASEAHYHNNESEELFKSVMDFLDKKKNVRIIILPRNEKQSALVRKTWTKLFINNRAIIPCRTANGLNVIWHSDLLISGGGTMNREAAALGVPAYSIFRGKIGAVDQYLAKTGRLTLLRGAEDMKSNIRLTHRNKSFLKQNSEHDTKKIIADYISQIVHGNGAYIKESQVQYDYCEIGRSYR